MFFFTNDLTDTPTFPTVTTRGTVEVRDRARRETARTGVFHFPVFYRVTETYTGYTLATLDEVFRPVAHYNGGEYARYARNVRLWSEDDDVAILAESEGEDFFPRR